MVPIAVAAVVAAVAGAMVWWDGHRAAARGCAASAPRDADRPAGGALVVAEQGFSKVGPWSFAIGAIVANRASKPAAYESTVVFRLLDSRGQELAALAPRVVPVVLPGGGLPVGAVVAVTPEQGERVARGEVVVQARQWVRVDRDNALFRRYDVAAEQDGGGPGEFLLPANGGPCRGLEATGAAIVYRDGGGRIVGGEAVAYNGGYCGGTEAGDRVTAKHPPDGTDPGKTRIAVYCDV